MPQVNYTHVVEIKVHGVAIDQESLNVFYYGSSAAPVSLSALEASFKTVNFADWQAVVTAQWQFTQIDIAEVLGGTSFEIFQETALGLVVGQSLPPFNTFAFTYVRGGIRERNGYKRLSCVPEASQDGGFITAPVLAQLDTLAADFASDLNDGTNAWHPTIRRDQINHVAQIPPKWFSISFVKPNPQVSSQNSRKRGHGR